MQWEGAWASSEDTTTPSIAAMTLTAGRGLIIAVIGTGPSTWSAPTVTGAGNTVSVALSPVASVAGRGAVAFYFISNISTGGSQTVTTGTFTAGKGSIYARECSGQDTAGMFDVANSATGASASASVGLTTTVDDGIIVAFGGQDYSGGDPSSYGILSVIAVANLDGWNFGGDTDAAGTAGAKTITFTMPGSDDWILAAAAFKGVAPPPPVTTGRGMLLGVG